MDLDTFQVLVAQVRAGEGQAAAELVRAYEPALLREVRMWLTDPGLRRLVDSADICQSVLASFFLHVATGDFDLQSPSQLVGLLATMAHNSILNHQRRQQTRKRDAGRLVADGSLALEGVADRRPSPSQAVADAEVIQRALDLLTPEERHVLDERAAGRSWPELAAEMNTTPEALRKNFARAIERVSESLRPRGDTNA